MNGGLRGFALACRAVLRHPGFLLVASFNLALGVAASVGAFSLVDGLILHRPPFPHHARVMLYGERAVDGPVRYASPLLYRYVGRPPGIESRGIARTPESVNVGVDGMVTLSTAQRMDVGFLPTLGVRPILGEGLSGAPGEALVSHGFWVRRLHGDARAIGATMIVNGTRTSIRGVLPADYRFFTDVDLFLPLDLSAHTGDNAANMMAVARLAPGTLPSSFSRRVSEVTAAHAGVLRIGSDRLRLHGATPLDAQLTEMARPSLLLFFACACVVLAIAGLNLSNLLLVRAVARSHETALRMALGARGWRPMIPATAEALLIGVLATAAGMPLGLVVAHVFAGFLPGEWMISAQADPFDRHVATFGVTAVVVTLGIAFAGGSLHERAESLFRERFSADRGFFTSRAGRRARWAMNVLQTALAVMLSILCVGTATRFRDLESVPSGFDAEDARIFEIKADDAQFPTVDDVAKLFDAIGTRLLRRPGIDVVGMSNQLPASGSFVMPFALPDGTVRYTQYGLVTPGALQAMGLRLVSGRFPNAGDAAGAERIAVVNEAYLRTFAAVGGDWVTPASKLAPNTPLRIVGVVADTRHAGPATAPEPTVFIPLAQAWESSFDFVRLYMPTYVIVRGTSANTLDTAAVDNDVHAIAPFVAVAPGRSLRDDADAAVSGYRRDAAISAVFALFAMLLACIGLYSSQSVEVASRHHDFALRGALGATPLALAGLIVSRNVGTAMLGACLGLGSVLLMRDGPLARLPVLESKADATVAVSSCAAMLLAAFVASGLPAWRAARIDPIHAIRGK